MTCKIHVNRSFVTRRWFSAWVILALLLTVSMPTRAADTVMLDRIGFYEGNRNSIAPDWGGPEIKSTFARESTRSIFTLIQLKNNLWLQSEQRFKLSVRYLHPDGRQLNEDVIETRLPADWEYIDLSSGWGWENESQWDFGYYRVEVWLDDTTLLGDGQFFIKADTSIVTVSGSIEFEQMGFYEGGDEGANNAPDEWTDVRLQNNFIGEDSRYIFTLVSVKNGKWNIEDQQVNIYLRYYRSNGEMFGDPVIEYQIPQEWASARLWSGWGWPDPGNWQPDRYRVELWLDNNKKIGESYFTVH